jgi:serine/threonine-protein kinase
VTSIPQALDELVLTLLAKKPEERFPSADVVRSRVVRLRKELADPAARRTDPVPEAGTEDTLVPGSSGALPRVMVSPASETRTEPRPPSISETRVEASPDARHAAADEEEEAPDAHELSDAEVAAAKPSRAALWGVLALFVALLIGGVVALQRSRAVAEPVVVTSPEAATPTAPLPEPEKVTPGPAEPGAPSRESTPVEATPASAEGTASAETGSVSAETAPASPEVGPAPVETEPTRPEPPPAREQPVHPPVAAPAPRTVRAPKADRKESGKEAVTLAARVKKLNDRLLKAEAAGANVALYRRQVEKVGAALGGALSADDLERLENLVARLEASTEY